MFNNDVLIGGASGKETLSDGVVKEIASNDDMSTDGALTEGKLGEEMLSDGSVTEGVFNDERLSDGSVTEGVFNDETLSDVGPLDIEGGWIVGEDWVGSEGVKVGVGIPKTVFVAYTVV